MIKKLILVCLFAVTALCLGPSGRGEAAGQPSDAYACLKHIPEAEKAYGIPKGLLLAIGVVEARWNNTIWPWTLNINGEAHYLESSSAALMRMRTRDGSMHRDMAVGCMQIFVRYHGEKFRSAADMLDPRRNVWYAASFLSSLKQEEGNWIKAVGRYHAGNPTDQRAYLCRVVEMRIKMRYQGVSDYYKQLCR